MSITGGASRGFYFPLMRGRNGAALMKRGFLMSRYDRLFQKTLWRSAAIVALAGAGVIAGSVADANDTTQRRTNAGASQDETRQAPRRTTTIRRNAPARSVAARTNADGLVGIEDVPIVIPDRASRSGAPTARRMSAQTLYGLPFKGEDLKPGERYYRGKKIHSESGSQKWGYDLGAMKLVDGVWRSTKPGYDANDPKNSDYYVYGKPVYAMGAGTIIKCWRNAPDNPRPYSSALGDDFEQDFEDREWLHQAWRDRRMSGAGNYVMVEEDDGDLVLYAHFKPGTLSSNLCPHNATLFSGPNMNHEADVPVSQRKRVKKGQKLGLVGNSGNSSGPHYHEHIEDADGNPVQLKFERGLSTPVSGGNADINKWTSFRGKMIPPGQVLIWPPRSLGKEYARHGMPAATYQRIFDWLAESGYQPVWIDGYSVGGKPYLNHVWRPATGPWRSYHLLTSASYQSKFTQATGDGFRPVHVESSLVNGKVRYSAIFVKNKPGGFLARHGLTYEQHMDVMNEAKSEGLSPVNVSVVSVGGKRRYTVLYRSDSIGQWQMKSRVKASDYQALYNQNAQAGRRPSYVNAYMHKGAAYFSVIFSKKPTGQRKDRHGLTKSSYQSEFNSAHQAGLLTRAVSGYDGAQSNHRYIAIWRK